jgi:hypothetical protein
VVDESAARILPFVAVILAVVDQYVALRHVAIFVAGHAGDDLGPREMLGRPADFLRRGPITERQAGENRRVQMLDRLEQYPRLGHFGESRVEIAGVGDAPPKFVPAMAGFELARGGAKQFTSAGVEIGENSVGVEEQVRHR